MARVPPDSKKYGPMTRIAQLAARLTILVFPMILCASLAQADELQDINGLLKQGQHAKALDRVNHRRIHRNIPFVEHCFVDRGRGRLRTSQRMEFDQGRSAAVTRSTAAPVVRRSSRSW